MHVEKGVSGCDFERSVGSPDPRLVRAFQTLLAPDAYGLSMLQRSGLIAAAADDGCPMTQPTSCNAAGHHLEEGPLLGARITPNG